MVDIAISRESNFSVPCVHVSEVGPEPSNYKEAMTSEYWRVWKSATKIEWDGLKKIGTFDENVEWTEHKSQELCGSIDEVGLIAGAKARLIGRGDKQD